MHNPHTIEIDAPPGATRPDIWMRQLLKEVNLDLEYKDPESTIFGCWTWNYSELNDETWAKLSQKAEEYLTIVYNRGHIRYASW